MFLTRSHSGAYPPAMSDAPKPTPDELARLTVADPDEIRKSLSFALRFDGRKRVHWADVHMSNVTTAWVSAHSTIPLKD